jgi:hypothetical protein
MMEFGAVRSLPDQAGLTEAAPEVEEEGKPHCRSGQVNCGKAWLMAL